MSRRQILTSLALAALAGAVLLVVASRLPGELSLEKIPGVPSADPGTLEVRVKSRSFREGPAAVRAEFPQFPDAPALSSEVEAYVEDAISQFLANVRDNDAARRATAPAGETPPGFGYTLDVTWDPAQLNRRHVSFALRADAFEGGANLRQEVATYAYDPEAQRAVALADLFPGQDDYLPRVAAYVRQVLEGQLGDATSPDFLDEGTAPTPENFSRFTFTDEAVTFIFPKYQVAPGAAGEQRVAVPRNFEDLQ